MKISAEAIADLHACARQLAAEELPPGWRIVPSSAHTRVAYNRALQIYYKEFLPRGPLERLRALLTGGRAARARKHANALLYVGIEAPAVLAWGKLPLGSQYLFSQAAAGQPIDTWLEKTLAGSDPQTLATRRQLLENLGVFIGRVHATGFIHGNLHPDNVLADLNEGRFQFTLLDNERTTRKIPPPGRMLLKNLMQLGMLPPAVLGKTDRMRFFKGWRRQMRELSPIEAKVMAAEAYLWTMQQLYEKGLL